MPSPGPVFRVPPVCYDGSVRYDIVTKMLLQADRRTILRELLGEGDEDCEILDQLPGETVSLRSADFAIRVGRGTKERILLLEIQTRWDEQKVHAMVEYRSRFIRQFPRTRVLSMMLLLLPHAWATGSFSDESLTFRFRLIKLWELEADQFLNGSPVLLPFIPLMKNGLNHIKRIEKMLYEAPLNRDRKGDLLSALTILTGLHDRSAAEALFLRRRDMMIESPIYDLIIQEGIEKGMEKGVEQEKFETARRMAARGYGIAEIRDVTDLSAEDLQRAGIA